MRSDPFTADDMNAANYLKWSLNVKRLRLKGYYQHWRVSCPIAEQKYNTWTTILCNWYINVYLYWSWGTCDFFLLVYLFIITAKVYYCTAFLFLFVCFFPQSWCLHWLDIGTDIENNSSSSIVTMWPIHISPGSWLFFILNSCQPS